MDGTTERICQEIGSLLESHQENILRSIDGLATRQERLERWLDTTLEPTSPLGGKAQSEVSDSRPNYSSFGGVSFMSDASLLTSGGLESSPDASPNRPAKPEQSSRSFGDDPTVFDSSDTRDGQADDKDGESCAALTRFKSESSQHEANETFSDSQDGEEKVEIQPAKPSMLMKNHALKKSSTEAQLNMSFIMDDMMASEINKWSKRDSDASARSRRPSFTAATNELRGLASRQGVFAVFRSSIRALVLSAYFDWFSGFMILGNAVLIGLETDYIAAHGQSATGYRTCTALLNTWYVIEAVMRMLGLGSEFWCGRDKRWNWFDLVMLTSSLVDMTAENLALSDPSASSTARTIRLFRVARVLRVIRMLRYIMEFRKLVFSMATSMATLFWSMMLMIGMMFCFGVFFTQISMDHLRLHPAQHFDEEDLQNSFGSLLRSMYSLYLAITAGRGWGELSDLLLDVHPTVTFTFIFFVTLCCFGVMNVVTSVFVESAMQSSQHYKDLLVQEKMLSDKTNVRHMKEIFKAIDVDESGAVSYDEMVDFLENPDLALQSYFEALDINATDTRTLFHLLDEDMSGEVDIDEFCDGCMRLRGNARSFDLHTMRYEVKKNSKRLAKFMQHVMRNLRSISEDRQALQALLSKQSERLEQSAAAHSARMEKALLSASRSGRSSLPGGRGPSPKPRGGKPLGAGQPLLGIKEASKEGSRLSLEDAAALLQGPPRPISCPMPPPPDDDDDGFGSGAPPDDDND